MRTAQICLAQVRRAPGLALDSAFKLARDFWYGRPLVRESARLVDDEGGFVVLQVADDTGREWTFRYPADAAAAVALERELQLLDILARRLPVPVPQPVTLGLLPDGDRLFAGYPVLRGVPCLGHVLTGRRGGLLAGQLAGFLNILHTTGDQDVSAAGVAPCTGGAWRREHLQMLARARRELPLPDGLTRKWAAGLDNDALWPDRLSLIHADLDPRHVLVDRERALLGVVLAWGRTRVADPAVDFADLRAGCGPQALEEVLTAYGAAREEPVDDGFRARIAFHSLARPVRIALHGLDNGQAAEVRLGMAGLQALA
jgi:macrolide phosphotransferase